MPVLTVPRTRLIHAGLIEPGMRITRDVHVGNGVFKPAEPLTVTAVYLFRDRSGRWVLLMVFTGRDLWPLPWCDDFQPNELIEVVAEPKALTR